jgi:hypothetical protein
MQADEIVGGRDDRSGTGPVRQVVVRAQPKASIGLVERRISNHPATVSRRALLDLFTRIGDNAVRIG